MGKIACYLAVGSHTGRSSGPGKYGTVQLKSAASSAGILASRQSSSLRDISSWNVSNSYMCEINVVLQGNLARYLCFGRQSIGGHLVGDVDEDHLLELARNLQKKPKCIHMHSLLFLFNCLPNLCLGVDVHELPRVVEEDVRVDEGLEHDLRDALLGQLVVDVQRVAGAVLLVVPEKGKVCF